MKQSLLQIRELTINDFEALKQMETMIEDDYVVEIFPDLVQSDSQFVYGLFSKEQLLSVAGYTVFPGGFAILGRLRSDHRFLSKGYSTEILSYIMEKLKKDPAIVWIGANTNETNKAARRVLEKLGLQILTTFRSLTVAQPDLIRGSQGPVWHRITELSEKKALLTVDALKENALHMYPYECYYPLPLNNNIFTDEHLRKSAFFQSPDKSRLLIIKNDQKRDWYAQVKYFWNDHYEQPGFWETINAYLDEEPNDIGVWIDFSVEAFKGLPNFAAFHIQDAWVQYGIWK